MKKLSIPVNIATGTGNSGYGKPITFATEMRTSKRAKNGLFTLVNEASFKKKIHGKVTRVKNEFKSCYELEHSTRSRSRGGTAHYFYLKGHSFDPMIEISHENYLNIFKECIIIKGIIQEELIYSNYGFLTSKEIEAIEEMNSLTQEREDKAKSNIKEPRVFKKNLIPGNIYIKHDPSDGTKDYYIFYGTLSTAKGDLLIFERIWGRSSMSISNLRMAASGVNFAGAYFTNHLSNVSGVQPHDPKYKFLDFPGNGGQARILNAYSLVFQKTCPQLWELPKEDSLEGLNIYRNVSFDDIRIMEKLLSKPYRYSSSKKIPYDDFYGVQDLDKFIQEKYHVELELEDAKKADTEKCSS